MDTLAGKLDFTLRLIVLILTLTVGMVLLFFGARSAMAATLKAEAVVQSDIFTVGDIFSGLDQETADRVLGHAPEPGSDMVLDTRTLMRIASALELPWRPVSSNDQIVVRRSATLIKADTIKAAILDRLAQDGHAGTFVIDFLGAPSPEMVLPQDAADSVAVAALDFDPRTGRFTAHLVAPSQDNPVAVLDVAGNAGQMTPVPVLKQTLSAGDVIGPHDIEWLDVRQSNLQNDVILTEEDLTGMTPRRMMAAGKPVRPGDLERPQMIGRGDTVTINYHSGPLTLTAQGKALQAGAKGDVIRVVNTASSQPVEAFVENAYAVAVYP